MSPDVLIKKLLAQREFWCELEPGKRVRLRRPAEAALADLLVRDKAGKVVAVKVDPAQVNAAAVGWEGFTEADLLTSGAADAVDFSPELWVVVIEDRRAWLAKCSEALLEQVLEHERQIKAAAGN